MSIINKCRLFWSWNGSEQRLCIEAFYRLLWASLRLKYGNFLQLSARFGNEIKETEWTGTKEEIQAIQEIAQSIQRARMFAFWRPKCYPQAIAAKIMLRNRKIPATLYVGVLKKEREFKAHAWTRSRHIILSGEEIYAQYTVLATFS